MVESYCSSGSFYLGALSENLPIGPRYTLGPKKRLQAWNVLQEFMNLMKEKQMRDVDTAMYECRQILEKTPEATRYASIIVDEGQDFSTNAFRLLRALAGPEHENDLFIVGDAHQRIYKSGFIKMWD